MAALVRAVKDLKLGKGDVVVVILPDSIRSYLSKFADDDWLAANDLLPATEPVNGPDADPAHERKAASKRRPSDPYAGATIRDLRLKPVTSVLADSPCSEAIETMREKGFDQLPVLASAGGKLVGLVTLGNLLSYISRRRASGKSPVKEVMFDFSKLDEVVTDPRKMGGGGQGTKRKFVDITLDTPLSALSKFFEWNSAAVVTDKVDGGGKKPVAIVTKVDLLTWMVKQVKA
jgi:cystathionine beta-synthase